MVLFGGNRDQVQNQNRGGGLLGLTGVDESVIAKAKLWQVLQNLQLHYLFFTPFFQPLQRTPCFRLVLLPPSLFSNHSGGASNQVGNSLQTMLPRGAQPDGMQMSPADNAILLSQLQQLQQQQQQLMQQQHQQQQQQVAALATYIAQGGGAGMNSPDQLSALTMIMGLNQGNQNRAPPPLHRPPVQNPLQKRFQHQRVSTTTAKEPVAECLFRTPNAEPITECFQRKSIAEPIAECLFWEQWQRGSSLWKRWGKSRRSSSLPCGGIGCESNAADATGRSSVWNARRGYRWI
ncbi:hypothetical protein BC829DRAFT_46234 [Chytridium lagenaria]|nr:hypothetical protein BC829DRAFT_46234 [Chytridium lagenaria]